MMWAHVSEVAKIKVQLHHNSCTAARHDISAQF